MKENPQKENGYTAIANELVEALSRINLSSYEWRVLMVIFRKTYGYQKKDDWIALSQIVSATGMHKSHVSRAKSKLIKKRIVTQTGNKLSLNKYHSQWCELPERVIVTQIGNKKIVTSSGNSVTSLGNPSLPKQAYTKETVTKETSTKENIPKKEYGNADVNAIINCMEECFGKLDSTKAKNRQYAWLLLRKTDNKVEPCIALIRAASKHNWWKSRITKVETVFRNAHLIANALRDASTPSHIIL